MHRDLARYLVLLAVVRVLAAAAVPAPLPWPVLDREHCTALPRTRALRATAAERVHRDVSSRPPARPAARGSAAALTPDGARDPAARRPVTLTRSADQPAGADSGSPGRAGRAHRGRRARHRQRGSRGGFRWRNAALPGTLRLCAINIQSLRPKIIELSREIHDHHYDVTVVCETWLKPSVPNRLLVIPGFRFLRADWKFDPTGHGGVAILCRDAMDVKKIDVPSPANPVSRLESLWCVLRGERMRVVVGAVYRMPRNTSAALNADFEALETQYQHVITNYPECAVIIAGDLNANLLRDAQTHAPCKKLSDFIATYSLSQLVTEPTYRTGSLLDVFIVNRHFSYHVGTRHCHFSPHKFIRLSCDIPKPRIKPTVVHARLLKRIDFAVFDRDLMSCDWGAVLAAGAVADKWDLFSDRLLRVLDCHAPVKPVKLRNPSAPPISDATRDLIIERAAALRVEGHGSEAYRAANRAVRSAIRSDVRRDIAEKIRVDGPSSMWKHVRTVVGGKRPSAGVEPTVSADVINEFFVNVGPRVTSELSELGAVADVPARLPRVGSCAFTLQPVTLEHLHHTIFSMRNSSACGTDGLCIRVIKLSFNVLGPILLHIINASITHSDVPRAWKYALVHPIHKSGDPNNPSNFRPSPSFPPSPR